MFAEIWSDARYRLRALFQRRGMEAELDAELRDHLERQADAYVRAGWSRDTAVRRARLDLGGVEQVKEQSRDTRGTALLESFGQDLRYGFRQLHRTPALSATIVVTLAIGIAATATVFSWTRSVLLDPLPGVSGGAGVLAIETTSASGSWTATSWLDYRDFRTYLRSFDGMAAAYPTSVALGDGSRSERRPIELVSANFFDVLRVRPALGHFFPSIMDNVEGGNPTVVISYGLWQARWHGEPSVVGSTLRVNGFPFTVVGVAPEAFRGSMPGQQIELWIPAAMIGQVVPTGSWWLRDRGTRTFRVLARLAPGATEGSARAELDALTTRMAEANGDVNKGMRGLLMPIWKSHWGMQDALRAPLMILLAACGLVLLIVCANGANLLLARATARRRELALRLAMGAPRARLLRQMLTEVSVLALCGAALGLFGAWWMTRGLRWLLPTFAAPNVIQPRVDGAALAFTALLAVVVALLAGTAPAMQGARSADAEWLRAGGRGASNGLRTVRLRGFLVAGEMALAVVALVAAGLFFDSVRQTRALSPGFDPSRVAMGAVTLTLAGYDSAHAETFLRQVTDELAAKPGVEGVSYTDYVPLSLGSGSWEDLQVEGYTPPANENMKLSRAAIGPGYFGVLRIPLTAGRDFTANDDSAHARVMIVNEAFVHRFLAGRSALGVRVHGWGKWFTVVGVAHDSKTYRLTDPPTPYFYVPVRQVYRPEYGYSFLVRTSGSVEAAMADIARAVRAEDPSVPVARLMPLSTYVDGPLQGQRTATQLLGVLALISTLLAAIGLYGVISYLVAQQSREIGVRIALGAQKSDVFVAVTSRGASLLGAGLAAGLVVALVISRVLSSLLYGVGSADAPVLLGASAAMVAVALLATTIPAGRAARLDPVVALRAE